MNDRTPEQINSTLDRTEQILSDLTVRLDTVILAIANIPELEERNRRRHQQHDLESDDHDERIERLERNHLEHASRMAKLEDIQADMKVMLETLLHRSIGEPGDTSA
jgi:hypothetical protein